MFALIWECCFTSLILPTAHLPSSPSIPLSVQGIWLPLRDGFWQSVCVCVWWWNSQTLTEVGGMGGGCCALSTEAHTTAHTCALPRMRPVRHRSSKLAQLCLGEWAVQTDMGWAGWAHALIFGQWPISHMDAIVSNHLQVCAHSQVHLEFLVYFALDLQFII